MKLDITTESPEMCGSPPARGAWIETSSDSPFSHEKSVAPRAGGVD